MKKRKIMMFFILLSVILGMFRFDIPVQASEKQQYVIAKKFIHYVEQGECLCSIAEEVYGDESCWFAIYEANRELIGENSDYLEAGLYLVLPEIADKEIMWKNLFDNSGMSEEIMALDSYIKSDLPYQIEEYYIVTDDKVYCYPQFISLYGRDMYEINEVLRSYAGIGYQITYFDESLLSIVFEVYGEESAAVNINIQTGDVYPKEELFTKGLQLPEDSSVFVNKAEVKVITGHKEFGKDSTSEYKIISIKKEELLQNQTNSPMWDKWNSDDKEAIQRRMILWCCGKPFYLEDINEPNNIYELGRSMNPDITQNVHFSPNGKYIYYHRSQSDGALYRIDVDTLKQEEVMKKEQMVQMASEVKHFQMIGRGNTFIYENNEGSLYYFDGEECCRIADKVADYVIEQDNMAVQYIRETDKKEAKYELRSYCFADKQSRVLVSEMRDKENFCRNNDYIFYKKGEDKFFDLYVNYEDGSSEYIDTDVYDIYRVYGRDDAVYYLKLYNPDYNKYDLYFWEAGKGSTVVAKDIRGQHISFDEEKGIIFYRKDNGQVYYTIDGTAKQLDIVSGSNVDMHEVSPDGTRVIIGYFPGELFRESGMELVCYRIENGELIYEQKLSEHGDKSCWLGDTYYFNEWNGTMEDLTQNGGNLYCYKNGRVWNTGQKMTDGMALLYRDGKVLSRSLTNGDLYLCEAGAESIKISDDSDSFLYLGEGRVFYTTDGKLFMYDGDGKKELLAERISECYGVDMWYKTF